MSLASEQQEQRARNISHEMIKITSVGDRGSRKKSSMKI